MKSKWINVSETKIAQILGEVNPEVQRKRQNIDGPSLNTKVHNAKYFPHKIYYGQNEIFRMFEVANVCVRDGSSGFRGFT